MEGFVSLQVTLKPAVLPQALRLVDGADTFRGVLEKYLVAGKIPEATAVDFLQGNIVVKLSLSIHNDASVVIY